MRALLALVALSVLGCGACGERAQAVPNAIERWPLVRVLASDALEGRAPGSEGSRKARAAIIAELVRCGVRPAGAGFEHPTKGPGINVIGELAGSEPGRYVVLSAHYDHLGRHDGEIMNGADDKAATKVAAKVEAPVIVPRAPAAPTMATLSPDENKAPGVARRSDSTAPT